MLIIEEAGGEESKGGCNDCCSPQLPSLLSPKVVVVMAWSEGSEVTALPWKGPILLKALPPGSFSIPRASSEAGGRQKGGILEKQRISVELQ